ncbi:xanthine dehydrogenase/oxidase-like [Neocloeon triangulifer]|uniref:xanthine dehydrogenase/oxidase-like n=1 Tax=Neocloeon triangulifer TaxID=2078957 RepID=UPI00286F1F6B|nr:xanthine dehydrogenase/oxidase-like [Neocloeon triangulifer]
MGKREEIEVHLSINGEEHIVKKEDLDRSLTAFIREVALLTGTKVVCDEGGCGACTVTVKTAPDAAPIAVNSCLVPIYSCHGWQVTTIEGLGSTSEGLNKVQAAIAAGNATQCGFCTPGFIMSAASLFEGSEREVSMSEVETALAGNLCRCTGYRPILEAFKPFCADASEECKARVSDIEDLCPRKKFCGKRPEKCEEIKVPLTYNVALEESGGFFAKVQTCKEVTEMLKKNPDCSLVAGSTAHGIFHELLGKAKKFIDIRDLPELRSTLFNGKKVVLGAALTITETQNFIRSLSDKPGFKYLKFIDTHINWIANLQTRNVGTIGGNIALKYLIDSSFASDLFVIFAGANAQMEIINKDGKTVNLQMTDESVQRNFQKIALIKSFSLPSLPDKDIIYQTFRVSNRTLNASAYVAAAFLLELKGDVIVRLESVQDGACFKSNPDLQNSLTVALLNIQGKKLAEVLANIDSLIGTDCSQLPLNLIKKFLLSFTDKAPLNVQYELSRGVQEFETDASVWPLNQPVIKIEALQQCAGESMFVNDMPAMTGELHAAPILISGKPGSRFDLDALVTDVEKEFKSSGVVAVITYKNVPGINSFIPLDYHSSMVEEEEIFFSGETKVDGQMMGLVVAKTRAKALAAAAKVHSRLTYWMYRCEVRKPTLTIDEAMKKGGRNVIVGPAKGRAENDKLLQGIHKSISGKMEIGNQFHFSLEQQSCVCVPEEGGMKVYSATQWPDMVQCSVSRALKVPANTVQVKVKRIGGGFGGKITRATHVAVACAVAANALKRPVRLVLDLKDNMRLLGGRAALKTEFKVDVDKEGKILNLDSAIYQNCGHSVNDSPLLYKTVKFYFDVGYDSSRFRVSPFECLTDTPSTTWCRAPGSTEGVVFIEEVFEHVAAELGLDPWQVRMANLSENDRKDSPLPQMVLDLKEKSNFEQRKKEIEEFNNQNKYMKKGIALFPLKYPFLLWGNYHATVSVYHVDGSVSITHGGVEMGQGINTKVAQACASALGISLDKIKVEAVSTLTAPNDSVTAASIGSDTCSLAVTRACAEINKRLEPARKALSADATWLQVIQKAYETNVNLCYNYMFSPTDETIAYDIYLAAVAEVHLDVLTGQKKVARVDVLEDVGRSLSPLVDVGQIEGAFVMGLGYWLCEGYVFDKENYGRLISVGTGDYKIPGTKDIPEDFRVYFRKNAPNHQGVLQTKASGEPAVTVSVVVLYALRNAIAAVWKDHGITNKHVKIDLPATPQNIINAISGRGQDQN